jgi:hypothetical protein
MALHRENGRTFLLELLLEEKTLSMYVFDVFQLRLLLGNLEVRHFC